jgi:hypothetical protein
VSTIVRAAASSSRPPDLSHANTRSGYCLSFGNTFSSFGLAPITSTDEKQKNTLLEFIWPLEEPFESWEVWGPWSLRSRYRSKKREVTLRSSLEPNAILAGLAFDTRNMILISELSDLQCLDPKDDHRERFVSLAFQVATILVCERFLLGRRMRMVIPRVHGLRLLPIVLWIGQNQFRADAAVCMEKDRFADELGSKGIMAGFLARRRYYVGLSLKQVPGIRTAELLCERDFNLLEIAFGFHNFRKYDSENADGIASGRIEGTVAYSHELGHIFAWLPQLVMMILLLEPDSTRTGFQELGFGNIPELIAEKMEQSQSLWLEQNYEPRNLFGRARGGTQEER